MRHRQRFADRQHDISRKKYIFVCIALHGIRYHVDVIFSKINFHPELCSKWTYKTIAQARYHQAKIIYISINT